MRTSASHLAFHYIHMMNNRLGVWPIEEAYLGALLAQISKNTTDIK
ncbi:lantibiotic dehydratase C-terminal domain-containing protein [Bacillus stercoris]|nr:lantibiotic dehydratase C-terminal domain-containing protein [Bacillus stercoris]